MFVYSGAGKLKPFVRVSSLSKPEDVCDLLTSHWGLDPPRIMISVTGGAKTFSLPPRLDLALRDGFERLSASGAVWFVTGGTNAGVMQYIGQAVNRSNPVGAPVLGVVPWSVLNNKQALRYGPDGEPVRGGFAFYGDPDAYANPNCSLDRHHTHFVLVDDGTEGKFQGEISFRAGLESRISKLMAEGQFRTPSPVTPLLICIQGGPGNQSRDPLLFFLLLFLQMKRECV